MNKSDSVFCQLIAAIAVIAVATLLGGLESPLSAQDAPVDFQKTIKPLFDKYCVDCHGAEEPEAFRIDLKSDAMDYITPGDAEDSQMYEVLVTDDESLLMPPPDEDNPMSEDEIKLVKTWINQGANWPETQVDQATQETDQPTPAPASADSKESSSTAEPARVKTQDEAPKQASDQVPDEADKSTAGTDSKSGAATPKPAGDETKPAVPQADKRIYRAIGSLHPAAIHLPIGLLLAAGLFALLSLRGNFVMSDCAYYCLWVGALGCIVACITGWWAAPMKFRTEEVKEIGDLLNQDHRVFWHRTGGLVVAAVSLVLAMFAASARNRDPDDGMLWKLCLILLAVAVGWVGHEGGKLTYGKYHYQDLNDLAQEWFPGVFGDKGKPKELPQQPIDQSRKADQGQEAPTDATDKTDGGSDKTGDESDGST